MNLPTKRCVDTYAFPVTLIGRTLSGGSLFLSLLLACWSQRQSTSGV